MSTAFKILYTCMAGFVLWAYSFNDGYKEAQEEVKEIEEKLAYEKGRADSLAAAFSNADRQLRPEWYAKLDLILDHDKAACETCRNA